MSAETDFRAVLAGYAGLTNLVSTRISQNAVDQSDAAPYVVFTASHAPEYGLDNTVHADLVTFEVQCWAETALAADAVADQVEAAIRAEGLVATSRITTFDAETGLDGTVITVEWWA